ncbi:hypothetical protein PEC18_04915 [Paucibacter sp. O1-1]|nr:hypothetical protein [Paucibacter sp. O1-1]MDA3825211.1 hypothetical protein [Paucibacter sp. O1-1]
MVYHQSEELGEGEKMKMNRRDFEANAAMRTASVAGLALPIANKPYYQL